MSLEFGAFDVGDGGLAEQRDLFENAFPEHRHGSVGSVEHYTWKFRTFPSSPRSYEYVAREKGRILGYYAALPYRYAIRGRGMRVGMVCDVMTDPDARGRGVFTSLGRFALEEMGAAGIDFVMGYPIRPEVMGGHMRVGWEVAFELPMYLRPLRADAILESKRVARLAGVVNLGVSGYQRLLAPRPGGSEYTSTSGSPSTLLASPEFARFLDAWGESVPHHLVKSAEFYAWRLGAPGASYQAFLVSRDREVVAAAIGRQTVLEGIPSLALLDVMVLRGAESALATLYRNIELEARQRDVEAIVTMMSRTSARRYRLIRSGFLRSPFRFKLILRSLSEDVSVASISKEADWHLMWIDSDDL